jgi:hypothetical protein
VCTLESAVFTDVYPGSTDRGTTFELSRLDSVVPVYTGNFHVEVIGDDVISGFLMLSRAAVPTHEQRCSYPRIGVPVVPEGSRFGIAVLPESPGEFIVLLLVVLHLKCHSLRETFLLFIVFISAIRSC